MTVFGDDDGVVFVPADRVDEVLAVAGQIRDTEHRQATRIQSGVTLRDQVQFALFLERRSSNPALSFREHLREVGGAIEE